MKRLQKLLGILSVAILLLALPLAACSHSDGKFAITVEATKGGSIASDKTRVELGDTVTCTLSLQSGYTLGKLTVNGGEVQPIAAPEGVEYDYIWQSDEVMRDYRIKAEFVRRDVTVRFVTGEGAATVPDQSATFGKKIGKLPKARKAGKRFTGWRDGNGMKVNEISIVKTADVYTLYAQYEDVAAADIEGLVPYALTTTYFDAAATAYGVVWHTEKNPVDSVVLIAEKPAAGAVDWTSAREVTAESEAWVNEYISTAAVDGLKFDTEYVVKVGDAVADKWSAEKTFRTRKEQIDVTKFFAFGASAEEKRIGYRGNDEIGNTTYLAQVYDAAKTAHGAPDFTAHVGSIVGYTSDSRYWQEFLSGFEDDLFNVPMAVSPGLREGEYYSAGKATLSKLFHYNVSESVDSRRRGEYYSFDFGPLHFISLCANDVFEQQSVTYTEGNVLLADQYDWLEDDLRAVNREKTPWVVVMTYEPIVNVDLSSGIHNAPSGTWYNQSASAVRCELGWQLWPLFTRYNVDLVLSGRPGYGTSTYPLAFDESVPASATSYPLQEVSGVPKKYVDHQRVSVAPHTVDEIRLDGDAVDAIVFTQTDKRGTVCQSLAYSGYARRNVYQKAQGDDRFRTYGTQGKNTGVEASIRNYSAYSYIEVTNGSLVLRTYGVDVKKRVRNEAGDTVYLDGFMLTK